MISKEQAAKSLKHMAKSWFVLYKYYEIIDNTELEWKNCSTVKMRQGLRKN